MRATHAPYQLFAQVWHYLLLVIVLGIPSGLIYQTVKAAQFQAEGPGTTCSWIGILYFVMIPAECYLLFILFWLQILRGQTLYQPWHLLQLMLIFLLGIVPGVLLLFPLFGR